MNTPWLGIEMIRCASSAVKRIWDGGSCNLTMTAFLKVPVTLGLSSSNGERSDFVVPNMRPNYVLLRHANHVYSLPVGQPQAKYPVRFPMTNKFTETGKASLSSKPG